MPFEDRANNGRIYDEYREWILRRLSPLTGRCGRETEAEVSGSICFNGTLPRNPLPMW